MKCWHVYVQMYWLLVKKEYIIVFVYIIAAIIYHTIRITASKWITHEHSNAWPIVFDPRPKGVVVNFVYSNHV